MTLQAVILDVDGTLADTEELHRRAFNTAFAQAGQDWHWDEAEYHQLLAVHGGLARIRAWVESHRPRELANLDHAGAFEAMHSAKTDIFMSLVEDGAPLRPGVTRLLRDARSSSLKLAVCASCTRGTFEALIVNALGFEALDWFDVVITREDTPDGTPAADRFRLTLDRLGIDARDAIAIEDNARGVEAAAAAGIDVIAVPSRWTRDDDFSAAFLVVSDMGEVQAPFDVIRGDPGPFSRISFESLTFWHDRAHGGGVAAA